MKPLLVAESNPYQTDPRLAQRFALYPDPPRCAGWNLCHKIMGLTEREYLARFDRVNLCDGKWSMREARSRAGSIRRDRLVNGHRAFVLCGARVCQAFGLAFEPFTKKVWKMNWSAPDEMPDYVILPHQSGLSRAWNEPGAFERARAVLREAGVL